MSDSELEPGVYTDEGVDGTVSLVGMAADGRRVLAATLSRALYELLDHRGLIDQMEEIVSTERLERRPPPWSVIAPMARPTLPS